ncbi:hypothetical protein GCM10010149_77070 [Nonomuraea roseoviolacea subsp. roseoviolacea]
MTCHGEEVAVIIAMAEYRRLKGDEPDFKEFLLSAPDWDDDIEFPHHRDLPGEVDLGR